MNEDADQPGGAPQPRMLDDIGIAVTFLTRLSVPWRDRQAETRAAALRFAPLIGVIIATAQTVTLTIGARGHCPSLVTAVLAVFAGIVITGGLHEDGLADVADGLGGTSRERRLAIMRDSRIGSYGALALAGSLLLRVSAIAGLLDHGGLWAGGAALFVSAPLSRALMLVPMATLPPARADGLARTIGTLPTWSLGYALILAAIIGLVAICLSPLGAERAIVATIAAAGLCLALTAWSRHTLGGVTGDLIGACQQVTEITLVVVLSSGGAVS